MNQIDLFGAEEEANKEVPKESRDKDHRPPNISVSKVFSDNMKWKECKIIGKNISIRSYSSACCFDHKYPCPHSGSTSTVATRCSTDLLAIFTRFLSMKTNPHSSGTRFPPKERTQAAGANMHCLQVKTGFFWWGDSSKTTKPPATSAVLTQSRSSGSC